MFDMNALELSAAVREKKLGVAEVVNEYIDFIEKTDKQFNAFLTISKDKALASAKAVQAKIDAGENLSPLAGVPIAIKDNISTMGIATTCASKMLTGYTPVFNATAIEKLEQAGMVIVGKLNMDEFAMGGSSETGVFGPVRNPWDTYK
jgi:aspartyl-tRNA(Asn)/glutamyl-tRNA(Gln) amidotransferase subunit A